MFNVLLLLQALGVMVEGARILAVIPSYAPSHHMVIQPILRTIAEAGHDVVVYSLHSMKNPPPNIKEVSLVSEVSAKINRTKVLMTILHGSPFNCMKDLLDFYDMPLTRTMENENVKQLLNSDEHFDLVITEPFFSQEFSFVFGYRFKAPVIGLQTFTSSSFSNLYTGNVLSTAYIPEACFGFSDRMSFTERLINTLFLVRNMYIYHYEYMPALDKRLRTYFPDMPPVQSLIHNLSLMFVNEHLTVDYARPRALTSVPVAGIHIEPERPLPQDIKDFMDKASNGVILFSLGSGIPDEMNPKSFFESVLNTFKNLPQRIIWKTRNQNLTEVPENVMVVQWMPQRDILAHPNCVLFITHGGQASYIEAVHSAVPVVGVPYMVDQHRNAAVYEARGVGVRLLPRDITSQTLTAAVRTVLEDPRYRNNMRALSRRFHDSPMSPKQTVVFWTEYVLRHRGAYHLKPAVVNLRWYQRYLLDVLLLVLLTLFAVLIIVVKVSKLLTRVFRGKLKTE